MSKDFVGIFRLKSRKLRLSSRKRSKSYSIIAPMSISDLQDDVHTGTGSSAGHDEISQEEKVFSNGEYYNGEWLDNIPHGHGKYLWNDGCIYVGEWKRGKTMGKGGFTWSCGATYDGEFRNGYMDGKGTYTGSNGDTYDGSWVMNLRHGEGIMSSDIGDCYDGEWKGGVQEGQGKYQWNCGHTYIGEWKDGKMNGNGTLTWTNGNIYEGCWEDGVPKGDGTFKWSDGSYYAGFWSTDASEQTGTYCPAEGSPPFEDLDWQPQDVYEKNMKDCQIWQVEEITMFPSQKMLNWPNVGEFVQRQLTARCDNYGSGKKTFDESLKSLQLNDRSLDVIRPLLLPKTIKKQGETISKGHKNYELMLNLQIGIRHSVARPGPAANVDLSSSAFDPREKLWTRFPPEGSKNTPPHPSCEFRWKDYCPLVFRTMRKLFKVDPADYMLSICGNDALRELSSPGKSGSFFYLTHDDKYMIKTMKKSEVKVLLRMLPAYYNHVRTFEDTLVTRFFGLHCVKLTGATQKKVRFVIMGNLFCTEHAIQRRFDLKGSSHGRTTDKSEISPTTTLKDLDLNYIFRLQRFWFQEFCRQVDRDCDFLEQERIMDYSLLVGLHFRESCTNFMAVENNNSDTEMVVPRLSKVAETDKLVFDPTQWESIKLGINMPARAEVTVRRTDCETQLVGEPTGECYEVIIFFGIIDILQDYDISKKLEHAYKAFQYDPTSISAVDPKQYSKRFRDFIFKVFAEDC